MFGSTDMHGTSSLLKQVIFKISFQFHPQGSIHSMLQSISSALCTVNGELCTDDQPLVSGEKPGKSSHSNTKSTQTFKIDLFTEEVTHCHANSSHHCVLTLYQFRHNLVSLKHSN